MHKKVVLDGVEYWLVPVARPANAVLLEKIEGLPATARKALIAAGYTHLEQFLEVTEWEILRMPGVGRKAIYAIRGALEERGMHVGQFKKPN